MENILYTITPILSSVGIVTTFIAYTLLESIWKQHEESKPTLDWFFVIGLALCAVSVLIHIIATIIHAVNVW